MRFFASRGLQGIGLFFQLIYGGIGVILCLLQLYFFTKWLGVVGFIAALVLLPAAIVLPLVHWFFEGFSPGIFGLWGIGFVALLLSYTTIGASIKLEEGGAPSESQVGPREDDYDMAFDDESFDEDEEYELDPDEWTEFWTWARARGFTNRQSVDDFLGISTEGLTPMQILTRLDAQLRSQR